MYFKTLKLLLKTSYLVNILHINKRNNNQFVISKYKILMNSRYKEEFFKKTSVER